MFDPGCDRLGGEGPSAPQVKRAASQGAGAEAGNGDDGESDRCGRFHGASVPIGPYADLGCALAVGVLALGAGLAAFLLLPPSPIALASADLD